MGGSGSASTGDVSSGGNAGSILDTSSASMDDMGAKFEEGLGVLAGLLEQCRVALDQIDFVGESFDIDMKIPYWAKSMIGGLDFVAEMADCVSRGENNQVKLMMCPMKYASAATDFMESLDNLFGLNNGHFWGGTTTLPVAGQYPVAQTGYQQNYQGYAPTNAQQTY